MSKSLQLLETTTSHVANLIITLCVKRDVAEDSVVGTGDLRGISEDGLDLFLVGLCLRELGGNRDIEEEDAVGVGVVVMPLFLPGGPLELREGVAGEGVRVAVLEIVLVIDGVREIVRLMLGVMD